MSKLSERIVKKVRCSFEDRKILAGLKKHSREHSSDPQDYSKVVVRKPWGYEYLMFANHKTAVWILYLQPGFQTSFHCHPRKKTAVMVLSGEAACSTVDNDIVRSPGEGVLLGKGVFHRTKAVAKEGAFVMEIESPIDKRDIVRFKDDYGREKLGYETAENMSGDLTNYNYITFIGEEVDCGLKKSFGFCSVELLNFTQGKDFCEFLNSPEWDAMCILQGKILSQKKKILFEETDILAKEDAAVLSQAVFPKKLEVVIVKKNNAAAQISDFVSCLKEGDGQEAVGKAK